MNRKLGESIALAVLLVFGISYTVTAINIPNSNVNTSIPPGYFPTMLGFILILLGIPTLIVSVREIKNCEEKIVIPNARLLLLTLVAITAYLVMWKYIHIFYPATFVFMVFLFFLYCRKEDRYNKKIIITNFVLSFVFTSVIYLLFNILLNIRF